MKAKKVTMAPKATTMKAPKSMKTMKAATAKQIALRNSTTAGRPEKPSSGGLVLYWRDDAKGKQYKVHYKFDAKEVWILTPLQKFVCQHVAKKKEEKFFEHKR